jgi:prephenate dehydrogenase
MKMFKKVTIIGVGLIGGSLGMAIRSANLAEEIIGVTRHKYTLNLAKRHKAINRGTLNIKRAIQDADLVIVATPVFRIVEIVRNIIPRIKRGCIITDVGSVKGVIVKEIEKIPRIRKREIYFVGGHPMAGSEKSGISSARGNLFKDSFCFLTETPITNQQALAKIKRFWRKLGAEVEVLSPQKHDSIVAYISHLPHILAYHLSVLVPFEYYKYAAGSFLDMTRIASSSPELWRDICSMNTREIDRVLKTYGASISYLRSFINQGRYKKLSDLFKKAKRRRDSCNKD